MGENLQQRWILSNISCPRCKEVESPVHTFFLCPFAWKVWEITPLHCAVYIAADDTIKSILFKHRKLICLPPSGVSSPILPWICWLIWTTRNKLIFENQNSTPEKIVAKSLIMAREWILAQAKSLTKNMIMPNSTLQQQQGAPRDRSVTSITIVCKTDASWDKAKKTGLGWIYTREEDTGTSQSTKIQESVASPLMAEARAVRSSITAAVNFTGDIKLPCVFRLWRSSELLPPNDRRKIFSKFSSTLSSYPLSFTLSLSIFFLGHIICKQTA